MGLFDSSTSRTRVGMAAVAVTAAGLFAWGLWWDQARVDEALRQAAVSSEAASVEPRAVSERDTSVSPTSEQAPEPTEQTSPSLAPTTEEPTAAPQLHSQASVEPALATSVPAVIPVQPMAPRTTEQNAEVSPQDKERQTETSSQTESPDGQTPQDDAVENQGTVDQAPPVMDGAQIVGRIIEEFVY